MTKVKSSHPFGELEEAVRKEGYKIVPIKERSHSKDSRIQGAVAALAALSDLPVKEKKASLMLALKWLGTTFGRNHRNE